LTLAEIDRQCENEGDAYQLLEGLRWPDGPVCPHCGNRKAYFLNPENGRSRKTNKGSLSQRRVWKCAKCRKQFSVLTDTIFHGTKVPIRTWLRVMVQMCSAKNGISAREIERMHGVTPETAWFMLHRLREAMKRDPMAAALHGTIIADETYFGGNPQNRHGWVPGKDGRGDTSKTPIMSLVNKDTGEVRSEVLGYVTAPRLGRMLSENVDMPNSVLHTDQLNMYTKVGRSFANHATVNHGRREYARGNVTTNHAEGYFAQVKRSIDGTHHYVTPKHLHRYVAEFDFRYTTCHMPDGERLQKMVDQSAGRRLSYKPLKEQP
jgi:transposase-like protein